MTRKENMALLKSRDHLFLDRDVEAIIASVDTSTRPLLEEDAEKVRDLDQNGALFMKAMPMSRFLWEAHSKRQRLSLWRFVTSGLDRIFL